jgi:hypothetical protein
VTPSLRWSTMNSAVGSAISTKIVQRTDPLLRSLDGRREERT